MNYVEKKAYSLLSTNGVRSLPVDTVKLARKLGYSVSAYSEAKEIFSSLHLIDYTTQYLAFTVMIERRAHIFYSDELSPDSLRHHIAHEIGHLQFDSADSDFQQCPFVSSHDDEDISEQRANEFGRYLVAPLPALDLCRANSAAEIQKLTGYSPAICKDIYANLLDYQHQKDETKELMDIQRLFRRFGAFRWLSAHLHAITVLLLLFVILVLGIILLSVSVQSSPAAVPEHNPLSVGSTIDNALPVESPDSILPSDITSVESSKPHTDVVYTTPTGQKYHKAGCHYIKDKTNLLSMPESQAVEMGYEPCKVCGG